MMPRGGTYGGMPDRQDLFKQWLVRAGFWGSGLFISLGILDYFGMPELFSEFLWYRVNIAVVLGVIAFISRTYVKKGVLFHELLGNFAIAASATAIELMIMRSGGHASPYYTGQILLGTCILGFVPARMRFHAVNALLIYGIYLVPILALDRIEQKQTFIIANGFMIAVFASVLVMRALSERMIDKEIALRAELARSEQKYRELFENAVEPVFLVDPAFRITGANRKAQDLSGYTQEELRTLSIPDMVPQDQLPRFLSEMENMRSGGDSERFEGKLRAKDGRWIDVEISSSAIMEDGLFSGLRAVILDISARKQYQDEVRRSREELESRVQERTAALKSMNEIMQGEIAVRRRAEQKLTEQLERQRALGTVERAIASSLDLSVTLNVFIEQVLSQLKPDAAAVLLYDRERNELSFAAARGFRSDRIMKVTVRAGRSLAGTVIAKQMRILISDLDSNHAFYPSPEGYQFRNAFMVRDEGFRAYAGIPLTVKGEVKGILEVFHRRVFDPENDWLEFLEALSQQASIAIDNASMYRELQRSHAEISLAYDKTIEGWSRALDIRDNDTHGHSQRVADLTVRVARQLGINDGDLVNIRRGALLHDIGKLGVPDSILLKPGRLTDEEMAVMKRHPEIAFDILSPIPFLKDALDIPYLHHEKWDGTGYPRGIRGEEIPVAARIFAVIDVWDALRSDRPYRPAWEEQRVMEYLVAERERHFDPEIVSVFARTIGSGVN
jgi:PAS domain S-box-containing protein